MCVQLCTLLAYLHIYMQTENEREGERERERERDGGIDAFGIKLYRAHWQSLARRFSLARVPWLVYTVTISSTRC